MILYIVKLSFFDQVLLLLNLGISVGICIRLICYRKKHARHKIGMSLVAYGLIVGYGFVAIRILTGDYLVPADWSEVLANAVLLFAVVRSRGNVARFLTGASESHAKPKVSAKRPSQRNPSPPKATKL